jgi:hypothetical protein
LTNAIAKAQKDVDAGILMKKTANRDSQIWKTLNIMDLREEPQATDAMSVDVYNTLNGWARQAGMTFEQWVDGGPHPASGHPDFTEVRFQATAHTTTARLAGFLLAVETNSAFPARVDSMVVTAQQPGQDDLHVVLGISALVYSPKAPLPKPTPVQATTRTSATNSSRGTVTPEPTVDLKAEEAMRLKREAEDKAVEKALAEQEAFNKLSEPEKEAWLQKQREEREIAATQKAADDAAKQKQLEAEMEKRRLQEQSNSPARGGVR